MSDKTSKGSERYRNWTFVLYPESAPENWRDYLDDLHIKWAESPLHDKDLNPDGEPKKPHEHIALAFEGKKSYTQVLEITDALHQPHPQPAHSLKGLIRYFAHLDNPDKYQYSTADIVSHGGLDVDDLLKPTSSARYILLREMITWCEDNNVNEYRVLIEYAMNERFNDWFPLLCDNSTYVMQAFLKSRRHSSSPAVDFSTGEVIE